MGMSKDRQQLGTRLGRMISRHEALYREGNAVLPNEEFDALVDARAEFKRVDQLRRGACDALNKTAVELGTLRAQLATLRDAAERVLGDRSEWLSPAATRQLRSALDAQAPSAEPKLEMRLTYWQIRAEEMERYWLESQAELESMRHERDALVSSAEQRKNRGVFGRLLRGGRRSRDAELPQVPQYSDDRGTGAL